MTSERDVNYRYIKTAPFCDIRVRMAARGHAGGLLTERVSSAASDAYGVSELPERIFEVVRCTVRDTCFCTQ